VQDQQTREKIGKRIKKLRVNKGFSQEEIAARLHIPRPSVSQIEHGKRDISVIELAKLSEVFGISPDEIIKAASDTSSSEKEVSEDVKKIYFMRHGEAFDDIFNQYGGWADPDLSAKGVSKAYRFADKIREKHINFDIIYSSPLKRAFQKAEIISQELGVDLKKLQYLKERNTYGLLCGMNKDVAQKKYPELVENYRRGEFVLGSERYDDFVGRLKLLFKYLQNKEFQTIACVTHGKLLAAVIKEYLGMNPDKLEDDCMLVVGLEADEIYYVQSEGIIFTK
jgi:probable phosphoglycerate mutase